MPLPSPWPTSWEAARIASAPASPVNVRLEVPPVFVPSTIGAGVVVAPVTTAAVLLNASPAFTIAGIFPDLIASLRLNAAPDNAVMGLFKYGASVIAAVPYWPFATLAPIDTNLPASEMVRPVLPIGVFPTPPPKLESCSTAAGRLPVDAACTAPSAVCTFLREFIEFCAAISAGTVAAAVPAPEVAQSDPTTSTPGLEIADGRPAEIALIAVPNGSPLDIA